jgi:hypothetical protein
VEGGCLDSDAEPKAGGRDTPADGAPGRLARLIRRIRLLGAFIIFLPLVSAPPPTLTWTQVNDPGFDEQPPFTGQEALT